MHDVGFVLCINFLKFRPALLEKMPVMESKLSAEPVTNGEVTTQPEEPQTTKEGSYCSYIFEEFSCNDVEMPKGSVYMGQFCFDTVAQQ